MAAHGVPSARFTLARTLAEALSAAERLGFPVVLKPRSLAGSAGVTLAHDKDDLIHRFRTVEDARYSTLPHLPGVLVEECLRGPEISVDSVSWKGGREHLQVTLKEVGFDPYFEEVAHFTADLRDQPWHGEALDVTERALAALGVDQGITHTELKLTDRGPVVVEVNGRLGGDFIPLLGTVSGGPDQVLAACAVALARTPTARSSTALRPSRVQFVYPLSLIHI